MSSHETVNALEELALSKFPENWIRAEQYDQDTNFPVRQNWLQNAKEIYNLALDNVVGALEASDLIADMPYRQAFDILQLIRQQKYTEI